MGDYTRIVDTAAGDKARALCRGDYQHAIVSGATEAPQ